MTLKTVWADMIMLFCDLKSKWNISELKICLVKNTHLQYFIVIININIIITKMVMIGIWSRIIISMFISLLSLP